MDELMKIYRILPLTLLLLCLLGCGKDPEPDTETTQPETTGITTEIDFGMTFTIVDEVVTAKDAVNLRDFPSQGEDAVILHKLENGERVQRIGIGDSGWSKLVYHSQECYAVTSYLTTDLDYTTPTTEVPVAPEEDGIGIPFAAVYDIVTPLDTVNLRTIPSTVNPDSQIVATVHAGQIIRRVGVSDNGWSNLEYEDQSVYAVTSYLTTDLTHQAVGEMLPEDPGIQTRFYAKEDKVTPKIEVNLRTKPSVTDGDAQVVATIKNGTVISRSGINEDVGWSRVEYEGRILYCVTQYLEVVR